MEKSLVNFKTLRELNTPASIHTTRLVPLCTRSRRCDVAFILKASLRAVCTTEYERRTTADDEVL